MAAVFVTDRYLRKSTTLASLTSRRGAETIFRGYRRRNARLIISRRSLLDATRQTYAERCTTATGRADRDRPTVKSDYRPRDVETETKSCRRTTCEPSTSGSKRLEENGSEASRNRRTLIVHLESHVRPGRRRGHCYGPDRVSMLESVREQVRDDTRKSTAIPRTIEPAAEIESDLPARMARLTFVDHLAANDAEIGPPGESRVGARRFKAHDVEELFDELPEPSARVGDLPQRPDVLLRKGTSRQERGRQHSDRRRRAREVMDERTDFPSISGREETRRHPSGVAWSDPQSRPASHAQFRNGDWNDVWEQRQTPVSQCDLRQPLNRKNRRGQTQGLS